MIADEHQYRVTLAQQKKLKDSLSATPDALVPEWAATASRDAIRAKIADLDAELSEYRGRHGVPRA